MHEFLWPLETQRSHAAPREWMVGLRTNRSAGQPHCADTCVQMCAGTGSCRLRRGPRPTRARSQRECCKTKPMSTRDAFPP